MKRANVGFVGPYSDPNLGDYGMLVNNLLDIRSEVNEVIVFTYDQPFMEKLRNGYFQDFSIEFHGVKFASSLQNLAKDGKVLTPIEILQGVLNFDSVAQKVNGLDVLVVNGGGYFNELWCQPHRIIKILEILVPVLIADDLGIPIQFTGNSFGPFGTRSNVLINILSTLRNATFRSRDRVGSIPELRRIGVSEEKISFIPDDLFVLNSELTHEIQEPRISEKYVVVELYQPLDVVKQRRQEFTEFNARMQERGLQVILLPFYDGRGGGDQAQWLADEFGWENTPLPEGYLPIEVAHHTIRNAELVLCERYHAMVFALANGVPVLHSLRTVMDDKWYYYRKNLGILDTALKEIEFNQADFMELDPFCALKRAARDFDEIRDTQFSVFDKGLARNVRQASVLRKDILSEVISSRKVTR